MRSLTIEAIPTEPQGETVQRQPMAVCGTRTPVTHADNEGLPRKIQAVAVHHGVGEACHEECKSRKGGPQPAQQLRR